MFIIEIKVITRMKIIKSIINLMSTLIIIIIVVVRMLQSIDVWSCKETIKL